MDRKYRQYEVVKETKLSRYMVQTLSKQYNIGTNSGSSKLYTEDEIERLKYIALIRRHSRLIYKLYNYIKKHPGCTKKDIYNSVEGTNYKMQIALAELTFMCYFWESDDVVPKYYIEGEFFKEYEGIFKGRRKDAQFKIDGRVNEAELFQYV